ncbi:hypothetical protein H7R39_10095 [Campylobacter sp. Marseille-Q3452]|uniref:Uncharacterized protein n=1 Tax=Campylobacter massiliensis TaxID=2762557 RepID=A0A842JAN5_9BACT|nr:hypothetical protein [Campylobacter massiliensis]MBC2883595.1 hypothetical protein [Campylobacter massiliensis]
MQQDFEITVKSTDNLRDELKTLFKTNEAYRGEEARALIQSLSVVDKMLNFKNKQDMKFSKDKIDVKLKMESGTYDLEIPMGEDNFSKQLDRLIDLTSKDISRNRPTRQEKEEYQTIIEKFGDGGIEKFKNPERESTFDKVLAGSLKTIETISQTAGEETSQFVSSFIATMKSAINPKDQESILQKDIKNILQILAKSGKDNNEKLVKKGERVKEHNKELDITK